MIAVLAACALGSVQPVLAQTYDPSASREVYDFTPFDDSVLLNLFYDAQQNGRQYPTL